MLPDTDHDLILVTAAVNVSMLLASVPEDRVAACIDQLKSFGYGETAVIGKVLPLSNSLEPITVLG